MVLFSINNEQFEQAKWCYFRLKSGALFA